MATLASSLSLSSQYLTSKEYQQQYSCVVEEIEGLIRVHKDGHVERNEIVPCVSPSLSPDLNVISSDTVIDNITNTWARIYLPTTTSTHNQKGKLPLLVYFHGGGFCVGSAAWSCYHDFLARLAAKVGCLIISVNYRLAPENPLPAAYDDGLRSLIWVKQQMMNNHEGNVWWSQRCDFSSVFLGGDSAGANIAYNVAIRASSTPQGCALRPMNLKGMVLIQPFFGGEARTSSEQSMARSPGSALNLSAADTYWRLALPIGANRDHPWCNPLAAKKVAGLPAALVCVAEMDILKDRNMEFCEEMGRGGRRVECGVHRGVGHAFQILSKTQVAKRRTHELMGLVKSFIMALS